jgi:hypothetical protein
MSCKRITYGSLRDATDPRWRSAPETPAQRSRELLHLGRVEADGRAMAREAYNPEHWVRKPSRANGSPLPGGGTLR